MRNPSDLKINWISTDKELPEEDGYYWCSNNPRNPYDLGACYYDGYGFTAMGIYRNIEWWSKINKSEKKYGKLDTVDDI